MSEEKAKLSGPDLTQGVELSTIPDGTMLLGHAQGEPVLLARRGDEVFAIGAICTHYGRRCRWPPCGGRVRTGHSEEWRWRTDSQNRDVTGAATASRDRRSMMMKRFKVGDHVTWNSEAGNVSGKIIKVHTKDVDYKGHTHHASEDHPQYEIKSSKTDHIAMHKGQALTKTSA